MDKIKEMGAKLSNLDTKMIEFFKSYNNDNYERNEIMVNNRLQRIDEILEGKNDNRSISPSNNPENYSRNN